MFWVIRMKCSVKRENETNDFLYGKLRNSEILSVYALASNFKEKWKKNKQNFMSALTKSKKQISSKFN